MQDRALDLVDIIVIPEQAEGLVQLEVSFNRGGNSTFTWVTTSGKTIDVIIDRKGKRQFKVNPEIVFPCNDGIRTSHVNNFSRNIWTAFVGEEILTATFTKNFVVGFYLLNPEQLRTVQSLDNILNSYYSNYINSFELSYGEECNEVEITRTNGDFISMAITPHGVTDHNFIAGKSTFGELAPELEEGLLSLATILSTQYDKPSFPPYTVLSFADKSNFITTSNHGDIGGVKSVYNLMTYSHNFH